MPVSVIEYNNFFPVSKRVGSAVNNYIPVHF